MSFVVSNNSRAVLGLVRGILCMTMGKTTRPGFYAVARGREVGVYQTWDECKANVDKFPDARYKKFPTEEHAWQFINENKAPGSKRAPVSSDYNPHQVKSVNLESAGRKAAAPTTQHCKCCTSAQCSSPNPQPHMARTNAAPSYHATMAAHATKQQQRKASTLSTSSSSVSGNKGKRHCSNDTALPSKKFKQEPLKLEEPESENGRVIVYTDGACSFNGQKGAAAGCGVYFGDKHPDNISLRLKGRQTNQRAEIVAARMAVEKARDKEIPKITLYTDSKYTINCITRWIHKWKENDWKTVNGKDVHNKVDLVRLYEACQDVDVDWKYVPGHSNIKGNEKADKLAVKGAQLGYWTTKGDSDSDEEEDWGLF